LYISEKLKINCQNDNTPKVLVITGPYFDAYAPWKASQTLINTQKNQFYFADELPCGSLLVASGN